MADVGQNTWEEVDFQPAASKGGENYGWSIMCGTHPFPIEKEQAGEKTPVVGVLPIAEYSHATDGICIVGLGVYRGSGFPSLDGIYFFGDWGSGRLWGIKRDDAGKWQMQELLHTALNLSSGGEDEAGNLYVTNAASQYGTWNPFDSARRVGLEAGVGRQGARQGARPRRRRGNSVDGATGELRLPLPDVLGERVEVRGVCDCRSRSGIEAPSRLTPLPRITERRGDQS